MRKIENKEEFFPELKGTKGRKVEMFVNEDVLKESGAAFDGALSVGDKIEFPEDLFVSQQEISVNGPKANLIGVIKNDKGAWLSIGQLRKRDSNMEPIGEVAKSLFDKNMTSDRERAEFLKGKTAEVYATRKVTVTKFTDNKVDGTEEKDVVVLRYVE